MVFEMQPQQRWSLTGLGFVLLCMGAFATQMSGGVINDLQAAWTAAEYRTIAAGAKNMTYTALLGDLFLIVPGLFLLAGSILAGLGANMTGGWVWIAKFGVVCVVMCTVSDVAENTTALVATGFLDLSAPDAITKMPQADGLVLAMRGFGFVKLGTLGIYLSVILLLGLVGLRTRPRPDH